MIYLTNILDVRDKVVREKTSTVCAFTLLTVLVGILTFAVHNRICENFFDETELLSVRFY